MCSTLLRCCLLAQQDFLLQTPHHFISRWSQAEAQLLIGYEYEALGQGRGLSLFTLLL